MLKCENMCANETLTSVFTAALRQRGVLRKPKTEMSPVENKSDTEYTVNDFICIKTKLNYYAP